MKTCSICSKPIPASDAKPYTLGDIHTYFCAKHATSLSATITVWMRRTMDQVERDRADAEADERMREERAAASSLAREIANDRMELLIAEGLPIATRREMRMKGRAA